MYIPLSLQDPVANKFHPLSSKITKSQLVKIVDPVVVIPRVLLLLSDTQSEMVYQHAMKVITITVYTMGSVVCIPWVV